MTALGKAGNDTITIGVITGGNVTVDGGDGADVISLNSGADNLSIVAGAGDSINVDTGNVNFVNFAANTAVTINGVEFKSDGSSSASLTFGNGEITFNDSLWTGTITASDDIVIHGFDEDDNWTYVKGSNDKSYKVESGQLFNNAWAKVNGRGIRTGEAAQSADETLDIEVITTLTSGNNYSIVGSASNDEIGGENGGGIIVSGGNVSVNAGAGNDEITFDGISGGNVTIDGGEGVDTISIGTITDGKVTVVSGEGDSINVAGGALAAKISAGSTINGVTFGTTDDANIIVSDEVITVDTYSGSITAGEGITVSDKNGATVTGSDKAYVMSAGAFTTWATITNADGTLYAIQGDPITGTTGNDTIKIADGVSSVVKIQSLPVHLTTQRLIQTATAIISASRAETSTSK